MRGGVVLVHFLCKQTIGKFQMGWEFGKGIITLEGHKKFELKVNNKLKINNKKVVALCVLQTS